MISHDVLFIKAMRTDVFDISTCFIATILFNPSFWEDLGTIEIAINSDYQFVGHNCRVMAVNHNIHEDILLLSYLNHPFELELVRMVQEGSMI